MWHTFSSALLCEFRWDLQPNLGNLVIFTEFLQGTDIVISQYSGTFSSISIRIRRKNIFNIFHFYHGILKLSSLRGFLSLSLETANSYVQKPNWFLIISNGIPYEIFCKVTGTGLFLKWSFGFYATVTLFSEFSLHKGLLGNRYLKVRPPAWQCNKKNTGPGL